jgi:hypothetical protein
MTDTPHTPASKSIDEPESFATVLAAEWFDVRRRRRFHRLIDGTQNAGDDGTDPPENLAGLALSGGGIRSATFNLGLLQGFRRFGMLPAFDYLSTVSGGGYVGGWWSAWLSRDPLISADDILDLPRFAAALADTSNFFSGFIREQLSPQVVAQLAELERGVERDVAIQHLVSELNRIVRGAPVHHRAEALGVALRAETRALTVGGDLDAAQINRMILEDAYPDLIARRSYVDEECFPPRERIEPERGRFYLYEPNATGARPDELRRRIADGAMSAGHDPIHHLRLFANYLTPRKGALSGDTWRAVAVISRNLILTWMILLPVFIAVMLAGQLYYVVNPSTTEDFLHKRIDPAAALSTARTTALTAAGAAFGSLGLDTAASRMGQGVAGRSASDTTSTDSTLADSSGISPEDSPSAGDIAIAPSSVPSDTTSEAESHHEVSSANVLLVRLGALVWGVIPFAGWIMVIVIAWMICGQDGTTRRSRWVPVVEISAVTVLVLCLLWIFRSETIQDLDAARVNGYSITTSINWWTNWYAILIWGVIAAAILAYGLRTGIAKQSPPRPGADTDAYATQYWAWRGREEARGRWRREVRRNRLVRLHSTLLITAVLISAVLLIGGFSHELINYIFYQSEGKSALAGIVKEGGGWIGLLVTIGGAIFTAIKASPIGGGDRKATSGESFATRAILAITPTAVVLLLALLAAWWAHGLLGNVVINHISPRVVAQHFLERSEPLHYATFVGVVLAFIFAWYEMRFRAGAAHASHALIAIILACAIPLLSMAAISLYARHFAFLGTLPTWMATDFAPYILGPVHPAPRLVSIIIAGVTGILLALRLAMRRPRLVGSASQSFLFRRGHDSSRAGLSPSAIIVIALLVAAMVALVAFLIVPIAFLSPLQQRAMNTWLGTNADKALTAYTIIGFFLCFVFLLFELFAGRGSNNRTIALLGAVYTALLVHLVLSYLPGQTFDSPLLRDPSSISMIVLRAHAALGLITTFLAWAIALGWTVDPNMLSIHAFYKGRLTRAYLGASNFKRHQQQSEITESVEGDDVGLAQLRNCDRGGPYHIVNATLNLVGGRDLTTAQRSAANFIMSRHFCGSVRTGYRDTVNYMDGRLSLGTAISISGAAASPNMGSKTPTAALAMLMTMFNVKLGYWAPTPNRDSWRSSQARLWPFYTLRELTSQTNDLSSYCYLTDGGHFDNTGLYALVERGCRYLVLSDCGADPAACFSDLGDAMRRCRIDFGLESEIDISRIKSTSDEGERYASAHFVVGKLLYSEAHLRRLVGDEARVFSESERTGYIIVVKPALTRDETIDVRQYGFENDSFPQQSLSDQWFDEAQFESYRKLGELSVEEFLAMVEKGAMDAAVSESARRSTAAQSLLGIINLVRRGESMSEADVAEFFEGVYGVMS